MFANILQQFFSVYKKIINTRYLSGALLIGFILAIAIICTIPIYTNGILQRMLLKDFENFQIETGIYPGYYQIDANFHYQSRDKVKSIYQTLNSRIENKLFPDFSLPIDISTHQLDSFAFRLLLDYTSEKSHTENDSVFNLTDYLINDSVYLTAMQNVEKHMEIVHGRKYSEEILDNTLEVNIPLNMMKQYNLILDKTYVLYKEKNKPALKIKIVGAFTINAEHSLFWLKNLDQYIDHIFISAKQFHSLVLDKNPDYLARAMWYCAYNYHSVKIKDIVQVLDTLESQQNLFNQYKGFLTHRFFSEKILKDYQIRQDKLKTTLNILIVPILILVFFYLFMVSELIIDSEETEIAVLKSRGVSNLQVFFRYLMQIFLLGFTAFLIGPFLGLFLCKIIGFSNGFLEFVQRTSLEISLSLSTYVYAFITLLFVVITVMLPTLKAAKISIVELKQKKARISHDVFWKKIFMDYILLAISFYGYYRYLNYQKTLQVSGLDANKLEIDPLLFLTSTLFILGAGLLYIRIYPYILRFIFWLGKKKWSAVQYICFIHVSRSSGREQFLMLFLIFSIAVGIFSANSARTLDQNIKDKIYYKLGADIIVQPAWHKEIVLDFSESEDETSEDEESESYTTVLREPPVTPYYELNGIAKATKVLIKTGKVQLREKMQSNVQIMGIIPHEFAEVSWFRTDLLPHHWFHYLNFLSESPRAMLVSRNFQKDHKANLGDVISFSWKDQRYITGIIYAFIDYWPTYNPNIKGDYNTSSYLAVGNLSYFQNSLALEPYQVWLKKQNYVSDKIIYDDIKEKKLEIESINSAWQSIILKKNDPMLQGINGVLTLCFIIIMIIAGIGFFIYWILTINSRFLQFGILRAMGLSKKEIIQILIIEQLLISGMAIFIGFIIGGLSCDLFIRFLQLIFSAVEQVPPFKVIAFISDYWKIYAMIFILVISGIIVLGKIITDLKINQVIKLGED